MKNQLVIIGVTTLLVCVGLKGCTQIGNPFDTNKNDILLQGIHRKTYQKKRSPVNIF